MKTTGTVATIFIFLAAAIWGVSFVTQRVAGLHMGPFTYNGVRFALGALSLWPAIRLLERKSNYETRKVTWLAGLAAGGVLFIAANLQQFGIVLSDSPSSASEAGFITGMYIIFVPILGLALGRKTTPLIWISALMAFGGLALIGIGPGASIQASDLLLVVCAVFWAVHILLIDRFAQRIDPIRFAATQFLMCAILCLVCAFIFEDISVQGLWNGLPVLLFGGIVASGLAYTLQVLGQRGVPPARAAVIFSLEAVFAALAEAVFLGDLMTPQKYLGGAVIVVSIILAQYRRSKPAPTA
ncbi:MAG: DMT family transporter [Oscillospiraceae bacterium]|nr:DMT family transporter [Oscillospiraceae bacterium]